MKRYLLIMLALLFVSSINFFPQEKWHLYNSSNSSIDENNLYSLALDSSQVVWLGGRLSLYRFINGQWEKDFNSEIDDSLSKDYFIYDIQTSSNGDVWFTKARYWSDNVDNLFRYSNGELSAYNVSIDLLEPHNLFVDENDQPWFVLYNWWPHQMGFDKIGTLEADTLRKIDLPWQASFFMDIIKMNDTLYLSAADRILKVYGDTWELKGESDFIPKHIWKAGNTSYVGSDKFSEFDGNEFKYFDTVDSFLTANNSKVSAFGYESENNLWIGTDTGFLLNVENGKIKSIQQTGNSEITDIIVDRNKNKWMIVKNNGVYVYNENTIVDVKNKYNNIPSGFELKQNYPNPFNPATTINYSLPSSGNVQIKVFDILGREAATLVNEFKIAGNYQIIWNADKFSSGIYFYSITFNDRSLYRKMILLK